MYIFLAYIYFLSGRINQNLTKTPLGGGKTKWKTWKLGFGIM